MKYRHGISSLLLCETDKLEKPGFKVLEISQCLTMTASQPHRERWPPDRQEAATMANEVNRIAELLIDAWNKADPKSSVALHPTSYVATFADMAKAIIKDRNTRHPAPVEGLETFGYHTKSIYDFDGSYSQTDTYLAPAKNGEWVKLSQAEAIIAAERQAQQRLLDIIEEANSDKEDLETQLAAARKALERVVKYSSPQSQAHTIARAALEDKP
jgi:hypothetical protein